MKHAMIDLETLGTLPGSVVMSIGVAYFDKGCCANDGLYIPISANDPKNLLLYHDKDTLDWWDQQSLEARKIFDEINSDKALMIKEALTSLNIFLDRPEVRIWSNGADFDLPMLMILYRMVNLKPSWVYTQHRCYRTLRALAPVSLELPSRKGTHHNALDDALYQAKCASLIMEHTQWAE